LPLATNTPTSAEPCTFELEELCAIGGCPESISSLVISCADSHELTKTPTDCDGSVVVDAAGFFSTSWFFDADGKLMGVRSSSDVPQTCANGSSSFTSNWGRVCLPNGEAVDACLPADGCAPEPLGCDASEGCPASPQDVMAKFCGKQGTLSVVTTPTTCGGTILLVEDADGAVRYCFDGEGRLVGTKSKPGATGIETNAGSDCIAQGTPTYACSDEPQ